MYVWQQPGRNDFEKAKGLSLITKIKLLSFTPQDPQYQACL